MGYVVVLFIGLWLCFGFLHALGIMMILGVIFLALD